MPSAIWLLIGLSLGLLFSTYSVVLANLSPYALHLGHEQGAASTLIMVIAITGFIGKLVFGALADKLNLKTGLAVAQLLVLSGFLVLALEPAYPLILCASVAIGLAAGGMLPVWGALMARVFGLLSYGRAMGMMGPVITLCVMPSFAVVGRLYDTSGSYVSALFLCCAGMVVSGLLLVPLKLARPGAAE